MLNFKSWQIWIGLMLFLIILISVFLLHTELTVLAKLPPTSQISQLSQIFNNQQTQIKKYEQEIAELRKQLNYGVQTKEILRLKKSAGLTSLIGKGLYITLNDSQNKLTDGENPEFNLVHYDTLELLLNELWSDGAEAISVNGYRISSTSGFSCAGSTILISTKKLAPPYKIAVIGDPDTLYNALMITGGYVEQQILGYDLEFNAEKVETDNIIIPPDKYHMLFEYAKSPEELGIQQKK